MEEIIFRLLAMVERLKTHPSVQVLNFKVFNGIDEKRIDQLETELEIELDQEIKSFFKITNGFQLRWIHKNAPGYNPKRHQFVDSAFEETLPLSDYLPDTGCINILPLGEIFGGDWENIWKGRNLTRDIVFSEFTTSLETYYKSIRPFDLFSKSSQMTFSILPNIKHKVILGTDHMASFTGSRITTFTNYLESLIHTYGIIDARWDIYQDGTGLKKDILVLTNDYWEQHEPINLDHFPFY